MQFGAVTVPVILLKQKKIIAAFRRAGAVSSSTAIRPETLGLSDSLGLRKLKGHAVLQEARMGSYYLDESNWEVLTRARRRAAMVTILILAAVGLAIWSI